MTTFTSQDREAVYAEMKKKEADGEPIPFYGWLHFEVKPLDSEKEENCNDGA